MEDAGRPKPDPAPYRIALQRLGVAPADAVAIDDSPAGVRSALTAGLAVVALPAEGSLRWGFASAHLVTDSPADLDIAILEMLSQSPRA
jgi:beta-phosphoglucomutase-like phosphatase (HAD superfamily)